MYFVVFYHFFSFPILSFAFGLLAKRKTNSLEAQSQRARQYHTIRSKRTHLRSKKWHRACCFSGFLFLLELTERSTNTCAHNFHSHHLRAVRMSWNDNTRHLMNAFRFCVCMRVCFTASARSFEWAKAILNSDLDNCQRYGYDWHEGVTNHLILFCFSVFHATFVRWPSAIDFVLQQNGRKLKTIRKKTMFSRHFSHRNYFRSEILLEIGTRQICDTNLSFRIVYLQFWWFINCFLEIGKCTYPMWSCRLNWRNVSFSANAI